MAKIKYLHLNCKVVYHEYLNFGQIILKSWQEISSKKSPKSLHLKSKMCALIFKILLSKQILHQGLEFLLKKSPKVLNPCFIPLINRQLTIFPIMAPYPNDVLLPSTIMQKNQKLSISGFRENVQTPRFWHLISLNPRIKILFKISNVNFLYFIDP